MIQEAQYDHLDPQNQQQDERDTAQQYGETYDPISLKSYQSYFDKINQALEQSSQLTNQMFSDQNFQQSDVTCEEIYNKQNMEDKGLDEISKKILEYQLYYGIQSPDIQLIQQQETLEEQNMSDQNTFQQNRFELLNQEIASRIQERAHVTTDQSNQFNLHTIEEEDIYEEDISIDKKHKIKKIEAHHQQLTESNTEEHQASNQQDQSSLVQNTQDQINQDNSQQDEYEERHNPPLPIQQEEEHKPLIVVKGNRYLIQNYNSNHIQQEDQPRFYTQSNQQENVFNLRQTENEEDELNQFQKIEKDIDYQQLYGNQQEKYEQHLNYQQQLQDHQEEDFDNRDSQQEVNENLQCDEQQELENEQQYQLQKQAIEAFVQQQNQQQQSYKESLNKQLIAHAEQQNGMFQSNQYQEQENQQSKIDYRQYDNKLTMEELSGKNCQSYRQIKNQRTLNQPNSDRTVTKQYKTRPQSPKNEEKLQKLSKQQNMVSQQNKINKNNVLSPSSSSNYSKIDRFNQQEQLSLYQQNKSPSSVSKNNKKINNQYNHQSKNEKLSSSSGNQNMNKKTTQQNELESYQNNNNNIIEQNYEQNIQQEQDQHFNPNSYLSSYSQNQGQSLYDYQNSQNNQMNHNQNYANSQENDYYYEQRLQNQNNKFQTLQKLQQEKLRLEKIKYKKLVQEQQEEREKKYIRQNKIINKEYSYNNSSNQITSISNQNEYFPIKMKTQQEYSMNTNKYYQKNMLTEQQNNSAYLEQQSNQTYLNSFKMKKKQMSLSNLSNQSENQIQNMYQMQQLAVQDFNKNLSKMTSPSGRRADLKSPQSNYNKDHLIQQNLHKNTSKNQQNNIRNEQNAVNIEVMKKIAQDIERQQALKQKRGQIDQNIQRETRVLIKNGLVADAINEMVLKTDKKSRSTSRTPSKSKKSAPTSKIISQKAKEQQMLRFQHAVVESTDNLKPKKSIQKNINNNYFANYFNESPIKKRSTPKKQSGKDATSDRGILMILENFSKKNQVNAKELKLNSSNQSITSRNQLTNKNSSNNSNNSMQLKTLLL